MHQFQAFFILKMRHSVFPQKTFFEKIAIKIAEKIAHVNRFVKCYQIVHFKKARKGGKPLDETKRKEKKKIACSFCTFTHFNQQ